MCEGARSRSMIVVRLLQIGAFAKTPLKKSVALRKFCRSGRAVLCEYGGLNKVAFLKIKLNTRIAVTVHLTLETTAHSAFPIN